MNESADFENGEMNKAQSASGHEDYYMENGFVVFTASYLKKRGYCCGNGCRHCPFKES